MYLQVLQLGKCYKFIFCTFLEHRKNVHVPCTCIYIYINIFVSLQLMHLKENKIFIDFFLVFTLFTEFVTCIVNFVGIIIGNIVFGVFSFTITVTTASSSSCVLF